MTTVGHPAPLTTLDLVSCLVAPSACAYGSEGWGFESLRARSVRAAVVDPGAAADPAEVVDPAEAAEAGAAAPAEAAEVAEPAM